MNFFVTLTYLCMDLYILCEYFLYLSISNISPIIRILVQNQGFRGTIIGHLNMCLVKKNCEKNWHVSFLAEEK